MSLASLNNADATEASQQLRQCCTSEAWIKRLERGRPFATTEALYVAADAAWQGLTEADYLQSFDGHPKIGDLGSLKEKYAKTKTLAAGEQASVDSASDQIINALAEGNAAYEEKFGFIFIICASGKSAAKMLALLQARLPNSREHELLNAAQEQRKIFHLRLEKLL
ncbi:MAG: 2-oxo-4-hydroxy-4-carboxy-5-ureidoimidazoline decarboxylase [Alcanivorax sp.]